MSDIGLEFPPWVSLAFLGAQYWYALAPAVLALVGIGWFGRALPIALRYVAWSAAGLCAAPFVLLLVLIVGEADGQARRAAEDRAVHRTLTAGETVGTLFLPAGAVLAYSDETHRALVSVALPRPMSIAGILLEGTLEPIIDREWSGVLAQDQVIGDLPCRAGDLWFTPDGVVTRCTLATDHRLAGYDLPAGAECSHNPVTGRWEFQPAARWSCLARRCAPRRPAAGRHFGAQGRRRAAPALRATRGPDRDRERGAVRSCHPRWNRPDCRIGRANAGRRRHVSRGYGGATRSDDRQNRAHDPLAGHRSVTRGRAGSDGACEPCARRPHPWRTANSRCRLSAHGCDSARGLDADRRLDTLRILRIKGSDAGADSQAIVAKRLVEHFERADFVVMNRPPISGSAPMERSQLTT